LTPPRKKTTARELSKYGNVIEARNITRPFVFDPARGLGYHDEKIHLCEVDTPEVIFLDCDTIINKNIYDLLKGDFDFCGRLGTTQT
jgi:hypothetical protein